MSAAWTPQWQFNFDVRADQAVVSAVPGQVIQVGIAVDLVRGNPKQVVLVSATNWSSVGITAQIIPTTVLPPSAATLYITVSPTTPPGSYMFAVRGDTQGTFASKEAMVTVVVTNAPAPAPGPAPAPAPIPAPAPVTPPPPPGRARRGRPVYPRKAASTKAAPQKAPKGAKLVAALVIIAALGIAAYASGAINDLSKYLNNSGGSNSGTTSGATTYYGTLVSCIGSDCASGPTPYVQVDSSGNVLGPSLYGKITNGVFTGYAGENPSYPMAGTLSSDGTFTVHLNPLSTSHSWTWTMHRQ